MSLFSKHELDFHQSLDASRLLPQQRPQLQEESSNTNQACSSHTNQLKWTFHHVHLWLTDAGLCSDDWIYLQLITDRFICGWLEESSSGGFIKARFFRHQRECVFVLELIHLWMLHLENLENLKFTDSFVGAVVNNPPLSCGWFLTERWNKRLPRGQRSNISSKLFNFKFHKLDSWELQKGHFCVEFKSSNTASKTKLKAN